MFEGIIRFISTKFMNYIPLFLILMKLKDLQVPQIIICKHSIPYN